MATWLDDLKGKTIQQDGSALPDRKTLNFLSGVTVEDNDDNDSTDVSIDSSVGGFKLLSIANGASVTSFSLYNAYKLLIIRSSGSCTIVYDVTKIVTDIQGNILMTAGDTLIFAQFDTGIWRQI